MAEIKTIPSGWVKASGHKKADWHWWGGGIPEAGIVTAVCGYNFSVMGAKENEIMGHIERQDFPPADYPKPTCYKCKKLVKQLILDWERAKDATGA